MGETHINPEIDSTLNIKIEDAFVEIAIKASRLRGLLQGYPGNQVIEYQQFKQLFDYWFGLSANRSKIQNDDLLDKIEDWLDCPTVNLDQMKLGLKFYKEYRQVLFNKSVLKFD